MPERCTLIAHRGYARHYPENTLLSFTAAVKAGADAVELDLQFAADGTPMVLHDRELYRTTGHRARVDDLDADQLTMLNAHEPLRFGDRFRGEPIPTLAQASRLLADLRAERVFLEIKPDTADRTPLPATLARVLADSEPLGGRRVIISYMHTIVELAASRPGIETGWVLPVYDGDHLERARGLSPDYLLCDLARLPAGRAPLAAGCWHWTVYEVATADQAHMLLQRDVTHLETMAIGELRRELGLDTSP